MPLSRKIVSLQCFTCYIWWISESIHSKWHPKNSSWGNETVLLWSWFHNENHGSNSQSWIPTELGDSKVPLKFLPYLFLEIKYNPIKRTKGSLISKFFAVFFRAKLLQNMQILHTGKSFLLGLQTQNLWGKKSN